MDLQTLCPHCFLSGLNQPVCPYCGHRSYDLNGSQQLQPGVILNQTYVVGMALGQGGFGITYLAYDVEHEMRVAIKEYFPSSIATRSSQNIAISNEKNYPLFSKGVNSFDKEAKILAQFKDHPNIIHVFNLFYENNTSYYVMEYIDGITFREYVQKRGGRISYPEARKILTPIMDALQEVHDAGMLHRDVAPDNIFLTKIGVVKLLDFGAARINISRKSQSSAVIVKPGYAPIEQYTIKGKQGPWTDVYALAATFYYALTGIVPPEAPERMNGAKVATPAELGASISRYSEAAILKALSFKAQDRFQTVVDFKTALNISMNKENSNKNAEEDSRESNVKRAYLKWISLAFLLIILVWIIGQLRLSIKKTSMEQSISQTQQYLELALTANADINATDARVLSLRQTNDAESFENTRMAETNEIIHKKGTVVAIQTMTMYARQSQQPFETEIAPNRIVLADDRQTGKNIITGGEVIQIPPGQFIRGSQLFAADERPTGAITISEFFIDKTEVTNEQYKGCVADKWCAEPHDLSQFNDSEKSDYPVVFVDYYQALKFCNWAGGTLPTEAEWEKAARGKEGNTYPWGNDFFNAAGIRLNCRGDDDFQNEALDKVQGNSEPKAVQVGSFFSGRSPYGVLDMAGNVAEWTNDWYDAVYYGRSPIIVLDPTGPETGTMRVIKGGSWASDKNFVRTSCRIPREPWTSNIDLGFRCVYHFP